MNKTTKNQSLKRKSLSWGEGTNKARAIAVLRFLVLLMGYPAGAPSAERALRTTLQIDEIR